MPQLMKRPDRHNEIELNLVLDGEIVYRFGGLTVALRSGQLGMFWASVPHQITSTHGNSPYFVVTVPLAWFLACRIHGSTVQRLLSGEMIIEVIEQRADLDRGLFLQWQADVMSRDEARTRIALQEIEARVRRTSLSSSPNTNAPITQLEASGMVASGGDKVARMVYFIAQHYLEHLSIERVSTFVDLHPNYAMELFRRALGTTLNDYINHHRVAHAQRLLVTSNESILEIAFNSGFNSLSRFNAVFKDRAGCTPRVYRRDHRLLQP